MALIAASADDVLLASAFARDLVASAVVEGAESVAAATLTALGILHVTIPEPGFASVWKIGDVDCRLRKMLNKNHISTNKLSYSAPTSEN